MAALLDDLAGLVQRLRYAGSISRSSTRTRRPGRTCAPSRASRRFGVAVHWPQRDPRALLRVGLHPRLGHHILGFSPFSVRRPHRGAFGQFDALFFVSTPCRPRRLRPPPCSSHPRSPSSACRASAAPATLLGSAVEFRAALVKIGRKELVVGALLATDLEVVADGDGARHQTAVVFRWPGTCACTQPASSGYRRFDDVVRHSCLHYPRAVSTTISPHPGAY